MVFIHTAGNAYDSSTCVLIPVRGTKTGESRHDVAAVGVFDFSCHVFGIRRGIDEAHLIAKPLDGGTCNEDGTLECVVYFSVETPCDRGNQSVLGEYRFFAGVHK